MKTFLESDGLRAVQFLVNWKQGAKKRGKIMQKEGK